jgi:2-hydroxychromene-2-carboxylate isomerase
LGPIFAQDRDIANVDVLADILSDLGRDPAAIMEASSASTNKERLRSQTEEAKRRGIFGAPSFTVGEELFWGNDRLGTAVAWSLGLR